MVLAEHADTIFALANVFFSVALVPSLLKRSGYHMPLITSAMTGGLLFLLGATFAEMGFAYSAMTLAISGSLWIGLMYQRVVYQLLQIHRYYGSVRQWVKDTVTRLRLRLRGR